MSGYVHIIGSVTQVTGAACLPVRLPAEMTQPGQEGAGRFLLVRCAEGDGQREEWSIYLRRALYFVDRIPGEQDGWWVALPASADPGHRWLAGRAPGTRLDVLGPFGRSFALGDQPGNVLLLADYQDDPAWLALLLSLPERILDRRGRVSLLVRAEKLPDDLVSRLPIAVEVHAAMDEEEWRQAIADQLLWADRVCACVPRREHPLLSELVRQARFRVEEGYAQVLVRTDLVCGTGACLACVLPTASGGLTRACVHGPVFDLTRVG